MKKAIIFVLLSLCGLSMQAQDWISKLRATVVEPASVPAEVGVVKHPWTGKKVLFIGDSITDPRDKHNISRHYYDWLSDWLGITAYVPAISGWEMKHVETEVQMFQKTAPGVQPDMICIMLGTNDYNMGVPIGEWYEESMGEVEASVGEPKQFYKRLHRTVLYDESTFKGRINIAVKLLKETFPGTPITFLTPIHRALFDYGNDNYQPEETWQNRGGLYLDDYVDAIKEVANVWSVNVIDLHAVSGFYPILDSDAALFYKDTAIDRLHPNDAGHKRLAEVILYQALVLPCR
jgi:lysophospholipase L1-like esterase